MCCLARIPHRISGVCWSGTVEFPLLLDDRRTRSSPAASAALIRDSVIFRDSIHRQKVLAEVYLWRLVVSVLAIVRCGVHAGDYPTLL